MLLIGTNDNKGSCSQKRNKFGFINVNPNNPFKSSHFIRSHRLRRDKALGGDIVNILSRGNVGMPPYLYFSAKEGDRLENTCTDYWHRICGWHFPLTIINAPTIFVQSLVVYLPPSWFVFPLLYWTVVNLRTLEIKPLVESTPRPATQIQEINNNNIK